MKKKNKAYARTVADKARDGTTEVMETVGSVGAKAKHKGTK